jgi:hypothetical protein
MLGLMHGVATKMLCSRQLARTYILATGIESVNSTQPPTNIELSRDCVRV